MVDDGGQPLDVAFYFVVEFPNGVPVRINGPR